MSARTTLARGAMQLQPEYVGRATTGERDAVFRFSVPVLRVRDVAKTVAWYRKHLGFSAEMFPERAPHEFSILERDGVQMLVRYDARASLARTDEHSGWDLYIWVDGLDLRRLETSFARRREIVRPLSAMGASVSEIEVRDPDGYVLCIGGPSRSPLTPA